MNSIQELSLNEIEEVSGGFFFGGASFKLNLSLSFGFTKCYNPEPCVPKPVCEPKPTCQPAPTTCSGSTTTPPSPVPPVTTL